jgi:hypothetical protein
MSKTKAEDIFEVKKVRVEVEVPLDEKQVEHRGMRLAQLGKTRRQMEQDAKDASSAARKEIKDLKKQIATMEDEIAAGAARVMVDAEERADFSTNTVNTIRMDEAGHGIVASTRAMTADERQLAIDVDAPTEAPVKGAKKSRKDSAPATH